MTLMGYESFNARLSSDHRGLFLDFDTAKVFGSLTPDLATPNRRILKSNNVRQVTACIDHMYHLLLAHNAFNRGDRLTYPGNQHQFAKQLDRDVLAASLAAEASIPQFGEHAWSFELVSRARRRAQYLRTHFDSSRLLHEYSTPFPEDEVPRNQGHCSELLRLAHGEIRRIEKQSYVTRGAECRQKIQELEASFRVSDKETVQQLRRMQKAEDINKAIKTKLRFVRGKHLRSGVVRLEIPLHVDDDPKTCTQWQQINVPSEIVRLLQERN
jgi:hypothetical protein